MDLTLIVVLGILGSSALLFLCYSIFILFTNPYEFIRLNNVSSKPNIIYRFLMLLAPPVVLCFGMYHVVFFLLGWMPENWGSVGENGYVTFRSSLSIAVGGMAGFFLAWAIGKGIVAQVQLSVIKLKRYLNKRIEIAYTAEQLNELQENLKTVLAGGSIFVEDMQLYNAINDSRLPNEVLDEIFFDIFRMIQRKLPD